MSTRMGGAQWAMCGGSQEAHTYPPPTSFSSHKAKLGGDLPAGYTMSLTDAQTVMENWRAGVEDKKTAAAERATERTSGAAGAAAAEPSRKMPSRKRKHEAKYAEAGDDEGGAGSS